MDFDGARDDRLGPAAETWFAPPERLELDQIESLVRRLAGHPLTLAILDAAGVFLMVLNRQRQILAVNRELQEWLGADVADACVGKRPGEALGCEVSTTGPSGCGTAHRCAVCGAVEAILASQRTGQAEARECLMRLTRDGQPEAREFRARATPIEIGGEPLSVLSLRDVSAEKRREALEHLFLHDLMNTIGGLFGWASLLRDTAQGEAREMAERIAFLGDRLRDEVEAHRSLMLAEEGVFVPLLEDTAADDVLERVERIYSGHRVAAGRTLEVRRGGPGSLRTDPRVLTRILGNMVRNALEATPEGGRVVVWYDGDPRNVTFRVWNPGAIPPDVQLRIFTRCFSTKARGRGLGTFGMKLFGERYLGGKVAFASNEAEGTTFVAVFPREGPRRG